MHAYRASIPEARPAIRGYRAPVLERASEPWPFEYPDRADPALRAAADHIAARLAHDGLLPTLAGAIHALGPERAAARDGPAILRRAGFPTDLLDSFTLDHLRGEQIIPAIAARRGESHEAISKWLSSARFEFCPTIEGFTAFPEGEPHGIRALRLQITGGSYWGSPGAGGAVETARNLIAALPGREFLAAISEAHIAEFEAIAHEWPADPQHFTLLPLPFPVAQWAQDNAKAGWASHTPATLVPRFASRAEDGSILIPGETFIGDSLAAAGLRVAQSPLLFQGGNLLLVLAPGTAERTLLIGEAEVYRNVALGLSETQATEALRIEFGAEHALVLPAVSFHIDFDLLPWNCRGQRLMFVNEPLLAARHILACVLPTIARAGLLDARRARDVQTHLEAGRPGPAAAILEPTLAATIPATSPAALAQVFSSGLDDGSANLQRILFALDLVHALGRSSAPASSDLHAYHEALRRADADRRKLHQLLQKRGWKTIAIPSLSEAHLSINYLNGLRDGDRYLMPAQGGLFSAMDRAAADILHRSAGMEVVPIHCAETQRRSGALHCAAAVYPDFVRTA